MLFPEPGDKLESESPAKYPSAAGVVEGTRVQEEFPVGSGFYTCAKPVGRLPGVDWGEVFFGVG